MPVDYLDGSQGPVDELTGTCVQTQTSQAGWSAETQAWSVPPQRLHETWRTCWVTRQSTLSSWTACDMHMHCTLLRAQVRTLGWLWKLWSSRDGAVASAADGAKSASLLARSRFAGTKVQQVIPHRGLRLSQELS